jgi:hypothetical protein
MQPKKRPSPKTAAGPTTPPKGQGPRRPVGMQALGPVRYEELRRALLLLDRVAAR